MKNYTIEFTEEEREKLLLATLKYKNEVKANKEKAEEFKNEDWAKSYYIETSNNYYLLEKIYKKLIRAELKI